MKTQRGHSEKPQLVRRVAPGERCPVCKGKRRGTLYGFYRRRIWNTKRPQHYYTAEYAAHGRGTTPGPKGKHIIGWCYVKGSCRRESEPNPQGRQLSKHPKPQPC